MNVFADDSVSRDLRRREPALLAAHSRVDAPGRYNSPPWPANESRLEVQEREQRGTRDSRRLRKEGLIPGVLYGRGNKPHPIACTSASSGAS